MSLERIIKALTTLGLTKIDARVYVHLATKGPSLAKNLGNSLKINDVEILRSIEKMQNIGIVLSCNDNPERSLALAFEKVLEMLIEVKEKQTEEIKKRRKALLGNCK